MTEPSDDPVRRLGGAGGIAALGAVAAAICAGLAIRALPFVSGGGLWSTPIDPDEGVYYGASALLWHGAWPYRDFTLLHPPGIAYLHSPAGAVSLASVTGGFVVARWTAIVLGALTTGLIATVLWRRVGRLAALVGVAVYALYPEITVSERGPLLEPAQNLFGAALILAWTSNWGSRRRRAVVSGVLLGVLVCTKYTGAVFLIACLASLPDTGLRERLRTLAELVASAAATFVILVIPWLVLDTGGFVRQTVIAQVGRTDGVPTATGERMVALLGFHTGPVDLHPKIALLGFVAVCACAIWFALKGARLGRCAASLFAAEVVFLLLVGQFWAQYAAILALPLALIGGWVAQRCWVVLLRRRRQATRAVAGVFGLVVIGVGLLAFARTSWALAHRRSNLITDLGAVAASHEDTSQPEGCVVCLPYHTLLATAALPPDVPAPTGGWRYLLDPYGAALVETGTTASLMSPSTAAALEACTKVVADADWVDALGPELAEDGFVAVDEVTVDGRRSLVLVRPSVTGHG